MWNALSFSETDEQKNAVVKLMFEGSENPYELKRYSGDPEIEGRMFYQVKFANEAAHDRFLFDLQILGISSLSIKNYEL